MIFANIMDLHCIFVYRCWQYRQLNRVHRVPRSTRPDRARRLGYKAKQGKINFEIISFFSRLVNLKIVGNLFLRNRAPSS